MSVAAKKILNKKRLASRVRFKLALRRNCRPRLSVFCSNNHIYTQIIDDVNGVTLVAASSRDKGVTGGTKIETANAVGKLIAEKALKAGVSTISFDRGGNLYHGRVKSLAEGAREAGLKF